MAERTVFQSISRKHVTSLGPQASVRDAACVMTRANCGSVLVMEPPDKLDVPQGTLELMILTILTREPLHGYGVSQKLAALSGDAFRVNPGSLFPLLYRLEQDGKLKAEWGASDNNRQAKFYRLTAAGRRQLEKHRERWDRVTLAIAGVLEGA